MRSLCLLACAGLAIGACAGAPQLPADVPEVLRPPAGESLTMVLQATGVQIYECRGAADGSYAWAFVAPEAELRDRRGDRMGHHDAGPRWHFPDGSRVVGSVRQRADAPVPGAIPWLLLATQAEGPPGVAGSISSIQRIHTARGTVPTDGCGPQTAGASSRMPYSADYYFYKRAA
jgi:hypothetical protein